MPVAYPASCSPQAWSSASVLLLIRTLVDLAPSSDRTGLHVGRGDLSAVPDLRIERLAFDQRTFTVDIADGRSSVVAEDPGR
jgi:glycogen debranching enzyme